MTTFREHFPVMQAGKLYTMGFRHLVYNDDKTFGVIGVVTEGETVLALEEVETFIHRVLTRFGIGIIVSNRF